ncbi:fungal-specific transcription factor domain-containing protein [Aspergillus germanicus]
MFSTFVGIEAGYEGRTSTGARWSGKPVWSAGDERQNAVVCNRALDVWPVTSHASSLNSAVGRRRKKGPHNKRSGYADIYTRLFGDIPVECLRNQSRSELLDLICSQAAESSPSEQCVSDSNVELPQGEIADHSNPPPAVGAVSRLRQLQLEESMIREWDENLAEEKSPVEDDASVLALSLDRASSYVGISSVMIAVRALAKVIPGHFCDQSGPVLNQLDEQRSSYPNFSGQSAHKIRMASYHERQRLIDAYFATIHVFAPIIHEPTFRNDYLTNTRDDTPWLALLNIVFALGSIALDSGDRDIQYYKQAHGYLTLESLGCGSLETLQALVLMGGLYLHYRNRPNLGSALMGASYRLACALGLHYDNARGSPELPALPLEVKRRIWWTIHVLDTWGTATLGRPLRPIDGCTEAPRNILDDQVCVLLIFDSHRVTHLLQHGEVDSTEPTIHSPLIHNISLCQIIARIQDRLMASPILTGTELVSYDNMLTSWFNAVPIFLRFSEVSTPRLHDARVVLKWRFQNTRILLYRPYILDAVVRNARLCDISVEEQAAVKHCRDLAADAISTIQCEWQPNTISCWHGV